MADEFKEDARWFSELRKQFFKNVKVGPRRADKMKQKEPLRFNTKHESLERELAEFAANSERCLKRLPINSDIDAVFSAMSNSLDETDRAILSLFKKTFASLRIKIRRQRLNKLIARIRTIIYEYLPASEQQRKACPSLWVALDRSGWPLDVRPYRVLDFKVPIPKVSKKKRPGNIKH